MAWRRTAGSAISAKSSIPEEKKMLWDPIYRAPWNHPTSPRDGHD